MSLNEEAGKNLFNHVLEIWVNPEIEKRRKEGKISDTYVIDRIQVITPPYKPPFIRFNEEVKAELICKLKIKPGNHKKLGEPIYENEVGDILHLKLTDEDDPNYGHLTMILFKNKWLISFDFRINKKLAKEKLEIGRDYLEIAEYSLRKSKLNVFVDNLFSAIELFVTSQLLVSAEEEYSKKQTHRGTSRKYNNYINLGNYKKKFKEVFNDIYGFRDKARYQKGGEFNLSIKEANEMLKTAKELEKFTASRIS
jgi:hypothetical protein